eukprot:CAMPEP_0167769172 /NCGR_PEP_ID=MMETSP0110_2-20121227/17144_1 /TAXON_ID=629695 /ORGANISM="Gymnochlora sp., Strain CCMP2014" /LENGTH=317 /DNA_ID=CAMNT_0007658065 /DNA_START=66 /DNA_END=1017 /DNA_ORIENTATION=-
MINEFLLGVLGSGYLQDKKSGETLDITQTVFVLTSNCYQDLITHHFWNFRSRSVPELLEQLETDVIRLSQSTTEGEIVRKALRQGFPYRCGSNENPLQSQEFADRLGNNLMLFLPHGPDDLATLANLELERLSDQLQYSYDKSGLLWDPKVPHYFSREVFNVAMDSGRLPSARKLHSLIQAKIEAMYYPVLDKVKDVGRTGEFLCLLHLNNTKIEIALYSKQSKEIIFLHSPPTHSSISVEANTILHSTPLVSKDNPDDEELLMHSIEHKRYQYSFLEEIEMKVVDTSKLLGFGHDVKDKFKDGLEDVFGDYVEDMW